MAKKDGRWTILARPKNWVRNATISESVWEDGELRRFNATICGYRNWRLWIGRLGPDGSTAEVLKKVRAKATAIRDRIEANDALVFWEDQAW